jgi:hypothetical protein
MRLATNVFRRLMPRPVLSAQWHDLIAESRTADLGNISDRFGIRPARFEEIIRTYMPGRNYFREMVRYVFGGQPF